MVYEFLLPGANNAQTSKQLCRILNISVRELTAAIQRERRAGKPICSTTGGSGEKPGYYMAATREEMQRLCDSLHHRAGEIYKTRGALLDMIELLPSKEEY